MSKTKTPTEIQSATINRVISKETGKVLGYLVKSDSEQGVYYQVTWDRENHRYNCSCPATKPCKHERAVSETCKARKQIEAEAKETEAEQNTTAQPEATVAAPVISEPPAPVAVATRTPAITVKTAQPTITNKGNTPLCTGGSFRMINGIPMR